MEVAAIREHFPGTRSGIYLNAASQSLLPAAAAERVAEVARRASECGVLAYRTEMELVDEARRAAARLIGCDAESVAFVANTAEGISKIAAGLDWREGDEVLLADLEYPANVYPWAAQCPRGARLRLIPSENGRVEAQRFLERIGPRTRVVAVSHVQFTSGFRVDLRPLAEACREREILLFVDAIQSLGVVPLEAREWGIAALAADARKWLMGPAGCALLYVAPEWSDRIRPLAAGAWSVKRVEDYLQYRAWLKPGGEMELAPHLRRGAGRFEAGFANLLGIAGLGAALELGERIGRERIHARIRALVSHLAERLDRFGLPVHGPGTADERAGIVCFEVPGDAERLFRQLHAEGISISAREGRLRAAPHVYNTEAELDALVEAVLRLGSSNG